MTRRTFVRPNRPVREASEEELRELGGRLFDDITTDRSTTDDTTDDNGEHDRGDQRD